MFVQHNSPTPVRGGFFKSRICLLAFSLVLALGLFDPARAEMIWGANGHPFSAYPGVTIDEQLDALQAAGLTAYRVNISRTDSIPRLAELVSKAEARGIQILPVITPALDLDQDSAEELYRESYALAFKLVDRFKKQIRVWELGNELENYAIIKPCEIQDDGQQYNCAWGPASGVGPLDYYGPRWAKVSAVLRGLSDATVDVDPTIRKAIGTAGWGHLGAFTRMKHDGIRWDISVWHLYKYEAVDALKFLKQFGHPVWVTEFNNPLGSAEKGEQAQADGLVRMMTLLRSYHDRYDLEAAFTYELFDEPYWAPSYEAHMGLFTLKQRGPDQWAPGRPKKAYNAVSAFLSANKDSKSARATASSPAVAAPDRHGIRAAPAIESPVSCHLENLKRGVSNPANQVAYAYCLVLHRLPTPSEQWRYVLGLRKDKDLGWVLANLLKAANADGGYLGEAKSNSDYVTRAYELLLQRAPDGSGMQNYLSDLRSGSLTREQMALSLIQAGEFKANNPILFPSTQAISK